MLWNRAVQRVLQSIQNSTVTSQSGSSITAKRVDENACENTASKCDAGSTSSAIEKFAGGASAEPQQTDMLVLHVAA